MDVRTRNNITVLGPEQAPVVMLAHGFGCDQNLWRLVAPTLARRFRVGLFDHVGAGRSERSAWSAERYSTLDAYAEDVLTICRELITPHAPGCRIELAGGGHPPALLVRAGGAVEERRTPNGQPAGVFDEPLFVRTAADLAPGDALLLYTDGLTEAHPRPAGPLRRGGAAGVPRRTRRDRSGADRRAGRPARRDGRPSRGRRRAPGPQRPGAPGLSDRPGAGSGCRVCATGPGGASAPGLRYCRGALRSAASHTQCVSPGGHQSAPHS